MTHKFLCDQMLVRLGKWLRAAGYDTVLIEKEMPDNKILEQAVCEKRLLLTRDIHFTKMAAQETVIYLKSNSVQACAQELMGKCTLNWLYRPFSRCLVCNALFVEPEENTFLEQVPPKVRLTVKNFWYCPQCKKMYWEGTHTKRMRTQLERWQKIISA